MVYISPHSHSLNLILIYLCSFVHSPLPLQTNGYTQVPHKETLHLFTPFSSSSLPSHTSTQLQKWCNSLDSLADRLISVLAQPVFERSPRALTQEAGLPCALGPHMGMLDVMRYRNIKYAVKSPDIGESTEVLSPPDIFSFFFLVCNN